MECNSFQDVLIKFFKKLGPKVNLAHLWRHKI